MTSLARRIPRILLATVLALLTLTGVGMAGMTASVEELSPAVDPAAARDATASRASRDDAPINVAVVLGRSGSVGSDVLAPYEVFARSAAFSVYTVAESDALAPIAGGPPLVPAHTFAEVDAGAAPRPDVVVVPALGEPTGHAEAVLRRWITRQHDAGAHILGICAGSRVLAATGMLDGRRATSHWGRIDALEESDPAVNWVRGRRYVRDGRITTTAGVTSGIPGALEVVEDLAGSSEAERVGRHVGYPGWSLDASPAIAEQHHTVSDLPVAFALALPWFKPTVGVALTDGVGETDLSAAFEAYTTAYTARPLAIAAGRTITTRHGITIGTTPFEEAGPLVDRIIVPGATTVTEIDPHLRRWADDGNVPVAPLRSAAGQGGFDAALEDLAAHSGRTVALTVAKVIDYPVDHLQLARSTPGWRLPGLLALALLLAVGIGYLPTLVRRIRRRRPHPAR